MSPEDWKAAWGIEHLIFANDQAGQLPESARQFLQSFGLPRYFTFDSAGVEKTTGKEAGGYAFEISFEQLSSELVPYARLVSWGDLVTLTVEGPKHILVCIRPLLR
jgi:hypothetical protein